MSNYICELSESVERIHVRYRNRYGIALAGDLYTMKTLDKTGKYTALASRRRAGFSVIWLLKRRLSQNG